MYEKHFHLRERPFALSPDPEYLYPSRVHQEALGYLRYGIEGRAGFVVITGEIGSGKTTMLQSLLGRLDRGTAVARIVNTMLEPRELLETILLDFGLDPTGLGKPAMLHRLAEFLVKQRQAGRLTLLVIDEAQNLSLPALEEIRMLSNLETEKSKLVQIIMVGQPELREKLRMPKLEQLRQRITVSYHLLPLDADETARYINHRLKRAAVGAALEFPPEVTELIHERSRGVPRIINVIADATLLFAYGLDRRTIDRAIAEEALAELDATGVLASYHSEGVQAAEASSVSIAEAEEAMQQADAVRQRERVLAARERELRDREQALTAQQRVVEEQARLLSTTRASGGGQQPFTPPSSASRPAAPADPVPMRHVPAVATGPAGAPMSRVPSRDAVRPSAMPGRAPAIARPSSAGRVLANAAAPPGGVRPNGAPGKSSIRVQTPVQVQSAPQVQPYAAVPMRQTGLWGRLRRAFFGVTEGA
jgi:putative secretion ATPase (PEP-CTERM system associated)